MFSSRSWNVNLILLPIKVNDIIFLHLHILLLLLLLHVKLFFLSLLVFFFIHHFLLLTVIHLMMIRRSIKPKRLINITS